MSRYTLKLAEQLKLSVRWLCCLITLILVFAVTAYVYTQLNEDKTSATALELGDEVELQAKVVRVRRNIEKLLTNEQAENRKKREVTDEASDQGNQNSNNSSNTLHTGYYEEQQPVVVHAESLPALGRRQDDFGAPPLNFHEHYDEPTSVEYDEQLPVGGSDSGEADGNPYAYSLRHPPGYYDDDASDDEDDSYSHRDAATNGGAEDDNVYAAEGRAAQNAAYDSYYGQWHYATPAPPPNGGWEMGANRKMQNGERDPYVAYDTADSPDDDYEYPGAPTALQKQQYLKEQQQRQQFQQPPQNGAQKTTIQQQQQAQPALQGVATTSRPVTSVATTENPLLSTLKSLKTMWDIYQAFAAAWNMLGTHQQKQQQQQQQQKEAATKRRQQQITQQTRINSKKPLKFQTTNDKYTQRNNRTNADNRGVASHVGVDVGGGGGGDVIESTTAATKRVRPNNKATKQPKTTTTTTTEKNASKSESEMLSEVDEFENERVGSGENVATKSIALARQNAQVERAKRQMSDTAGAVQATDVGEGRYIKGDPLKGYYDFVITEGSYKFWAVFQTGTALLIIYSTFAAIYYSKVNPLVSDYDYTDYLGGARTLNGGGTDADFIDDAGDDDDSSNNNNNNMHQHHNSWYDGMLPRAGGTMKYILDALDRLPVDHREADEAMKGERSRVADMEKQIEVADKQASVDEAIAKENTATESRQISAYAA